MRLIFLFLLGGALPALAQTDSLRWRQAYLDKTLSVDLGYNFNFGRADAADSLHRAIHFLEIGLARTNRIITGRHGMSTGYYFTNDISLNTRSVIWGPKIGGFITFGPFGLGSDLVYYTDFRTGSLRWSPYFGLCTPWFRLTINPHVILANRHFEPLNPGHLHLSIAWPRLWRQRVTLRS